MEQAHLPFTLRRTAGILLHVSSLPSGDLGDDAIRFAEYLREAGQAAWQIMPLGPPGPGNSPYAARSAFAGNPALLSFDRLHEEGLVTAGEIASLRSSGHLHDPGVRETLLRTAYGRFCHQGHTDVIDDFEQRGWVRPYALWMALHHQFKNPWWEWPVEFRSPGGAFATAGEALHGEARFHTFIQLMFEWQWQRLRHRVNELGITLIGDLPIFVDRDSADAWASPEIFKLDASHQPLVVAGVPPDAFSATGQRWGNPLYDWDALARTHYSWWVERIKRTFELVDIVRLDHFRGFQAAWEIPVESQTAVSGSWVAGPGLPLFAALETAVGKGHFIVEDLGMITEEVRELRRDLGYPGMAVLQFAFGDERYTFQNPHLPHNHEGNLVVYTGTHDNDTTAGWYETLDAFNRSNLERYLGWKPANAHAATDAMVRLAYASPARTTIVPFQDVLQLGSEARMNIPGVAEGNWTWRFTWDQVDHGRTHWLRELAETYSRFGDLKPA
ncbi:MAG: 4-alpha-glucanotransferase [Dehalococcoidia bacterium]|nr:4-alpha-glucanotransferase [Dehalococcoidia bacterium]